jgi:hypothetical protein
LQESIKDDFPEAANALCVIGDATRAVSNAARNADAPEAVVLVPIKLTQITPATDGKKLERRRRPEAEQKIKEKADERRWRKVEESRARRRKKEEVNEEARREAREARAKREAEMPEAERSRRERALMREPGRFQ